MKRIQEVLKSPNRILVFPFDLMAHYLRCLSLVSNLSENEVLFAESKSYNSFVHKKGFSTFKCEVFDPSFVMECAENFDFSWLNYKDANRVLLSQISVIKEHKPDLVIGDTSPTLKMAAEICGVRYVTVINGYMSKYYSKVRALSKFHPGHQHLSKLPPEIAEKITSFAERIAFWYVHKPFRKLRKENNLKRLKSFIDESEGDDVLICDHFNIFPQKAIPNNYHEIGPLVWESENNLQLVDEEIDKKKKTILVSMGSSGNWNNVAFLNSEVYSQYNIITAGDKDRLLKGTNVFPRDFLNLDKALVISDLFVCHGGSGTSAMGVTQKVKMLFFTSHFEQEWNVKGMEDAGFGKDITLMSHLEINQTIESILV
jgi:UDP:flavonoid glycosyltransferase YjiC (YdhE family)